MPAEIEDLRRIVAAQSKLLTTLVNYFRESQRVTSIDDDDLDELMEAVCAGLSPDQVKEYFPLAPASLKAG